MKTLKLFILSSLFISIAQFGFAQSKEETFKVSGECGMCKKSIEKAAKEAGASFAAWNADSKELIVKYDSKSSDAAKIQQGIAKIGYDTPNFKATDEAYNKLHGCCKYERTTESANNAKAESCCGADCCKDGKCTKDMDCCKDGKCTKEHACCKDGKCTKEHGDHAKADGSSCCKKA